MGSVPFQEQVLDAADVPAHEHALLSGGLSAGRRRVETASDFPNRRGRAMKNCEPREPSASSFRIAVLSTYVKPPPRSFSNVYVSVAAFSTPHIIAQHLTQAQGDPRERGGNPYAHLNYMESPDELEPSRWRNWAGVGFGISMMSRMKRGNRTALLT